ncbi:MAG: DUF1893 domain-containing protein [Armatimonadetes bacterium]|nr:DUF1893 domain-containing protein [Armatimonadota bacterium]
MNDLSLAKNKIKNNSKLTLVIVKNNKLIYKSSEKGLRPLFDFIQNNKVKSAALADKIAGKAAAHLILLGNFKEIFIQNLSQEAWKILSLKNNPQFNKIIPKVLNLNKNDLCPFEKLTQDCLTPEETMQKLAQYFNR